MALTKEKRREALNVGREFTVDKAKAMYANGTSCMEIAKVLAIPESVVRRIVLM